MSPTQLRQVAPDVTPTADSEQRLGPWGCAVTQSGSSLSWQPSQPLSAAQQGGLAAATRDACWLKVGCVPPLRQMQTARFCGDGSGAGRWAPWLPCMCKTANAGVQSRCYKTECCQTAQRAWLAAPAGVCDRWHCRDRAVGRGGTTIRAGQNLRSKGHHKAQCTLRCLVVQPSPAYAGRLVCRRLFRSVS